MIRAIVPAMILVLSAVAASRATEPTVSVTLVVILAGEEGTTIDPQLAPIADEIRKQNPQLKSFRLKSMTKRSLTENEKSEFDLVEGKKAEVVFKQPLDADNRVGVSVSPPDQGEIEYRTVPGKFLPIVTRYQTKDHQRLIFALRVDPAEVNQRQRQAFSHREHRDHGESRCVSRFLCPDTVSKAVFRQQA